MSSDHVSIEKCWLGTYILYLLKNPKIEHILVPKTDIILLKRPKKAFPRILDASEFPEI